MPKSRKQHNERLGGSLHKSKTRSVVAESAGVAASTFNSTSQSTESTSNSIAFSKALKLLNDIVLSGDITEELEGPLIDYIGTIEHYPNHLLPGGLKAFKFTETEWQQFSLAAEWARKVRDINQTSENTIFIPGSVNGSTKPFCLHTATIGGQTILVVAIRGTKTMMEWMANTNVEAVDCKELGGNIKCHRGFVNVAKNMQSLLAEVLEKSLVGEVNVLFTGHSGGAAIAQLLFAFMHSDSSLLAHFRSGKYSDAYGRFQVTYFASGADNRITNIDCVTFGGPPISNTSIPRPSSKSAMFLSFMNEGDPVVLAQKDYIHYLVQAWVQPTPPVGPIPKPVYLPSGTQVALRSGPMEDDNLLFGDPAMHSMTLYNERIQALRPQDPFQDPD